MSGKHLAAANYARLAGLILMALILVGPNLTGQDLLKAEDLSLFQFRNLGPFRAGSWVTCFAVPEFPAEAHLYTFYVGTRNGGVWKTTNNGTTFEPIFDSQTYLSIGALALAPSNPEIVWVGTGEAYCARSSHRGNGVYKSTDGGRSWKYLGLADTHHIPRIIVHPRNPDTVYVAAMGHLFTPNTERGVFKTEDGGQSWKKIFYVNDKIGVIDLVMDPNQLDTLYAATYDKVRLPWHYEAGGQGSGIYRTTDGGLTWKKLSGGLPSGYLGRIGIDIYRKNPKIIYAVVENFRQPTEEEKAAARRASRPAHPVPVGEVYRSEDGGETWKKVNSGKEPLANKAPYSFNQLYVDPNDDQKVFLTGVTLASSVDGGKTWRDADWPPRALFQSAFGDVRTLWIDPVNSNRILFGSDGGVYVSYDGGQTSHHFYNLPLGEIYALGLDQEEPYNIYAGLQDHDSWKGPSNSWSGQVNLSDWVTVGGGDGMYNVVDPNDSRWVYNCREFGGFFRLDQKTGTRQSIQPVRAADKEPYRFNWTPPIHLSPHNNSIVYIGAQVLLRSLNRGDDWEEISPDLTTNDKSKQGGAGNITFCTITTISESPRKSGVIWVGTDDGKVQLTTNGGVSWTDCTPALTKTGVPAQLWVSRILASPHEPGTAFVAKSGFRNDDFKPYLYKTTDYGRTWTPISAGLPDSPVNVIIQDHRNPDLLFAGTDNGLFISLDQGHSWQPFQNNMPKVKVTDLAIQPREADLVVGTYGRGIWITNIWPLQELRPEALTGEAYLFSPRPAIQKQYPVFGNYHLTGDSHLFTPNEPDEVVIYYYLREEAKDKVKISIYDLQRNLLAELSGQGKTGLNRVSWDMRKAGQRRPGPWVEPGYYFVVLEVAGQKLEQKALVRKRLSWSIGPQPVVLMTVDRQQKFN
ncbi:MAG: WD40/YVTN/BNR-like repeat-containing protein [Candidatus Saccharicenans sp.]|uniref:WD40/YVTN/BNR-like repeat-containing protein n=1 Tax=Candidatus Saccharicenans sp. TaxID=2819258 RepID=UPI00404B2546